MKRIRRRFVIYCAPILALLVFLLWPLSSRQWDINHDTDGEDRHGNLAGQPQVARSAPRIIIILADDLGTTDVGLYGGTYVPTPHIDSIGLDGVTFTDASCTTAICAPSRVSMLTGRYQQRSGFEFQPHDRYARNRLEFLVFRYLVNTDPMVPIAPAPIPSSAARAAQGVSPGEVLLSEILSSRGYRTAVYGKWHLGYAPQSLPLARGFDTHFGFYEAFSLYADPDDPGIVNMPVDDFSDRHMWSQARTGWSAIVRDGVEVEEPEYLTFRFADLASDYIRENASEPFFLYLPFNAPHTPLQVPREYYESLEYIEDPIRRTYYAMISALDDAVGIVLDAVRDAGIEDSAMIVFASDNGGVTYLGVTDNGPYAGGKFSTFQGGLSVPMMIRYPGVIPAGTVYDEPVSLMDIHPTVAARSGPLLDGYDGVDLLPFVLGERGGRPHEALFWRSGYNAAVRSGPWKLIIQSEDTPGGEAERLYDLETDPYEHTDLAESYPVVAETLRAELSAWETTVQDPMWPPVMHFHMDVWGETYWFGI